MKTRVLALFLVIAFVFTLFLYSCGDKEDVKDSSQNGTEDSGAEESETGIAEEVPSYDYPALDMGGRDFRVLNSEPVWNFTTNIVVEEDADDVVNDAIFKRNKFIEDKFNINMVEITDKLEAIESKVKAAGQAGDDVYDIILCPRYVNSPIGSLITTGLFYNLDNIPEINLAGSWWKTSSIESSRLGSMNGIYFLQSEITIMALQGAWCLFFNENMMRNLGLEPPYQMVKNGKWTLDELLKYVKTGMNLNGEDSFAWTVDGKAIYGLSAFANSMAAFVTGIDEPYIKKDSDNVPYLSIENDRFYRGISKILEITGVQGQYLDANDGARHYETLFASGKSFFIIAEFKSADVLRSMEDSFGILPMPKLDEDQKNYSHMVFRQCPVLVIPQTNTIPHETGTIVDALEFKTHTEVTPAYYDVSLSFKGLRNDESIEMMHIINNTIALDIGITYDWTRQLYDSFNEAINKGEVNIASLIEQKKEAINQSIIKTLTLLENMEKKLN